MYSKEEAQRIKREFWVSFAEAYPRKWLLYDTKIKDFSFKFFVDNKISKVMLDIEMNDDEKRKIYFEKIESLKTILLETLPDAIFERKLYLDSGKEISRIWLEKEGLSINNKNHWESIFEFFNEKMALFEYFFLEYQDYITDLETNT
jgi:hypothetical protein